MDIKTILQDEKKKRFLIIGFAVLVFLLISTVMFFMTRPSVSPQNTDGQLLADIAKLTPREGESTSTLQLAPVIALYIDKEVVPPGETAVISWNSKYATGCSNGDGDPLDLNGDLSISPTSPYTFEVICTGPKGTNIQTVTVQVSDAPIIILNASPRSVVSGGQSLVSWSTQNADRCVDKAGITLRLAGSTFVFPKTPYTFGVTCTGPKGESAKEITVGITTPTKTSSGSSVPKYTPPPVSGTPVVTTPGGTKDTAPAPSPDPIINLTASSLTVPYGESSTISWNTTNTASCTGSSPTGVEVLSVSGENSIFLMPGTPNVTIPVNGSVKIKVLAGHKTATLSLTCLSVDGITTTRNITVTETPPGPGVCASFGRPTLYTSTTPPQVENGAAAIITWSTKCATKCTAQIKSWGETIKYVDTSKIENYIDGKDYNTYTNIHNLLVGVNTSGGIRVHPGSTDPSPLLPTKNSSDSSGWLSGSSFGSSNATVTLSCVNSAGNTPYSVTKSISVPIIVHPSCGGYGSCFIQQVTNFVSSAASTVKAVSPTTWVDPSSL